MLERGTDFSRPEMFSMKLLSWKQVVHPSALTHTPA
jgi:hypothetical protein